jgi:hypothetical protein
MFKRQLGLLNKKFGQDDRDDGQHNASNLNDEGESCPPVSREFLAEDHSEHAELVFVLAKHFGDGHSFKFLFKSAARFDLVSFCILWKEHDKSLVEIFWPRTRDHCPDGPEDAEDCRDKGRAKEQTGARNVAHWASSKTFCAGLRGKMSFCTSQPANWSGHRSTLRTIQYCCLLQQLEAHAFIVYGRRLIDCEKSSAKVHGSGNGVAPSLGGRASGEKAQNQVSSRATN